MNQLPLAAAPSCRCGYDLRESLHADRCPECGSLIKGEVSAWIRRQSPVVTTRALALTTALQVLALALIVLTPLFGFAPFLAMIVFATVVRTLLFLQIAIRLSMRMIMGYAVLSLALVVPDIMLIATTELVGNRGVSWESTGDAGGLVHTWAAAKLVAAAADLFALSIVARKLQSQRVSMLCWLGVSVVTMAIVPLVLLVAFSLVEHALAVDCLNWYITIWVFLWPIAQGVFGVMAWATTFDAEEYVRASSLFGDSDTNTHTSPHT